MLFFQQVCNIAQMIGISRRHLPENDRQTLQRPAALQQFVHFAFGHFLLELLDLFSSSRFFSNSALIFAFTSLRSRFQQLRRLFQQIFLLLHILQRAGSGKRFNPAQSRTDARFGDNFKAADFTQCFFTCVPPHNSLLTSPR